MPASMSAGSQIGVHMYTRFPHEVQSTHKHEHKLTRTWDGAETQTERQELPPLSPAAFCCVRMERQSVCLCAWIPSRRYTGIRRREHEGKEESVRGESICRILLPTFLLLERLLDQLPDYLFALLPVTCSLSRGLWLHFFSSSSSFFFLSA